MMRSESAVLPPKNVKVVPKRIVFQLDISLDTLHYCAWTSEIREDRNCGTISEFTKALLQCKIIHPDDIHTFEQFVRPEVSPSTLQTVDIRLFINAENYAWYRLYVVAAENEQAQARTISGVMESLQGMQGSARHKHERLNQDTLFRKAVTSSAIISLGFDTLTGERLVSDYDVLPPWLPENLRIRDIVRFLRNQAASPENPYRLEGLLTSETFFADSHSQKPFYHDYQFVDLTKASEDIRWYRVYLSIIKESRASPACLFMTVMDIHEDKMQEQLFEENITCDPITGMPRHCAFEQQVTGWLENVRSEIPYSYTCAVVMVIDHAVDMIAQQGREYVIKRIYALSQTIKAFIHPQELCGRYGFAGFAMVLSGASRVILQERLNMLRMICLSLNNEWPDLQVRFGSNVELASQMEQGELFLEKANQALQSAETGSGHRLPSLIEIRQAPVTEPGNAASNDGHTREVLKPQGKHHIFIRTFGHFDVFVDGEAILFNHTKAKELLALLVDRRGGFVGATEAISCLWEDEPANNTTLSRCRKAALHLRETLLKHGIEYLMETVNGKRRITVGNCDCDYYRYLQRVADGSHQIPDSYLNEYSWAENTVAHEQ